MEKIGHFYFGSTKRAEILRLVLGSVVIFTIAFLLRFYFYGGFTLGDDVQEFATCTTIVQYGPNFNDQFYLRFTGWIFNVIFFKIFGISEYTFFLPTVIMSCCFSLFGFWILIRNKYSYMQSFIIGLYIASAPFEVLVGGLRVNDIIFSWLISICFLLILFLNKKGVFQSILLAVLLWLAFYSKIWVIYYYPLIFLFFLHTYLKHKSWKNSLVFFIVQVILHTGTCLFWKFQIGEFLPFINNHAASYPVDISNIIDLFQLYPDMIFKGSQFDTTFFGLIPYLLLLFLTLKIVLSRCGKKNTLGISMDRLDLYLFLYYVTFFVLLNFFPNSFKFDQYYSAPRIFRYLLPISFPMTLHVGKLFLDLINMEIQGVHLKKLFIYFVLSMFLAINIPGINAATYPTKEYQQKVRAITEIVKTEEPSLLITESWLSFFMEEIYLKDYKDTIKVERIGNIYNFDEYEQWLHNNEGLLKPGTLLLTGFGNYTHYGCHNCGFKRTLFEEPLNDGWVQIVDLGETNYLPYEFEENVQLWRWEPKSSKENLPN